MDTKNKLLNAIQQAKSKQQENSNKEIEVPKKPIIVNQPKVEPKKEEIKQEVKVEAPTIKEETKVENVDTTNSSKKIYTIPTYLTKDLKDKISNLATELEITIPKLIKIAEKEYVNNIAKIEEVNNNDTLETLLKKRKEKKSQIEEVVDKATHLIQVYCVNEKEKKEILANKEKYNFKTGSDYLRAVVSYIIPILEDELNKIKETENSDS